MGELVQAGKNKAEVADKAVAQTKGDAKTDCSAANRIQQERIGGDSASAAASIIDRELGV